MKAESIEAGAVRRAAFGERHVLGDPDEAGVFARRQCERKAGRRGEVGLARRGDLVQRAARQAAAERRIDRRDAERQGARAVRDPGGFLKARRRWRNCSSMALSLWRRE